MKWQKEKLEPRRLTRGPLATLPNEKHGAFLLNGPCGTDLLVLVTQRLAKIGDQSVEWEHLSVSTRKRLPNWIEMSFVKNLFWADDEIVLQYHLPSEMQKKDMPNSLHLWKPASEVPLPPLIEESTELREVNDGAA